MKQLSILIIVSIMAFISCDNATTNPEDKDPNSNNIKIMGLVGFELENIPNNSGEVTSKYFSPEFLSEVKVELIKNNVVVATTYTKESIKVEKIWMKVNIGGFFDFDGVQLDSTYRLKVSLNEENYKFSEPFTITKDDLQELDSLSCFEYFGYAPKWLEEGSYYLPVEKTTKISFDFLSNDIDFRVFPQPVFESEAHFSLEHAAVCNLEILNYKFEHIKTIYSGVIEEGEQSISLNFDYTVGMYIAKFTFGSTGVYYYPFMIKIPIG